MLYIVISFLWFSLLIYLIMGGADFGAGILELFTAKDQKSFVRKASYQAIGPIWEANHMWLIIAVVVLFVGFPGIYSLVSIYLHIPLVIMLIGIIARGTAFTFRNYDAVMDKMQNIYNKIYVYSSFITPLFLGIIAASAVSGRMDTHAPDFMAAYVEDWFDPFSWSVGLFTVGLCGFMAAVYLIGETSDPVVRRQCKTKAMRMNLSMLLFMLFILIAASKENIPLERWFFGNRISLYSVYASFFFFFFLWVGVFRNSVIVMRLCAILFVTALLTAATYGHFPNVILLRNDPPLSLLEQHAPEETIRVLGTALLAGSLFILPALIFLVYSFGKKINAPHTENQANRL